MTTMSIHDANLLVGQVDLLFITLDTLRYDVAQSLFLNNRIPNLSKQLPPSGWQKRHTPGSFTFAAHMSFFAGFLPTPAEPGPHPRRFSMRFPGSETTTADTFVFDAPDIVTGLGQLDYHTICIGGVGFFNKQTPLGNVLPSLFTESHWSAELGVTSPTSTQAQTELAVSRVNAVSPSQRVFLFLNVSAIHQPNHFYLLGCEKDNLDSHAAALEYVDRELGKLFAKLSLSRTWWVIICSDHGTAYGEDGYTGHRLAHPVVWEVPYAEFLLKAES
jgi:hypothetical protein